MERQTFRRSYAGSVTICFICESLDKFASSVNLWTKRIFCLIFQNTPSQNDRLIGDSGLFPGTIPEFAYRY